MIKQKVWRKKVLVAAIVRLKLGIGESSSEFEERVNELLKEQLFYPKELYAKVLNSVLVLN